MSNENQSESQESVEVAEADARVKKKRGGRPKGARNAKTIVNEIAKEQHTLRIDGKTCKVNTVELLLHVLTAKAMTGNLPAQKLLEKLRDRYAPKVTSSDGYLVVPEGLSNEEFLRRAEIVNKYKEPPKGLDDLRLALPDHFKPT